MLVFSRLALLGSSWSTERYPHYPCLSYRGPTQTTRRNWPCVETHQTEVKGRTAPLLACSALPDLRRRRNRRQHCNHRHHHGGNPLQVGPTASRRHWPLSAPLFVCSALSEFRRRCLHCHHVLIRRRQPNPALRTNQKMLFQRCTSHLWIFRGSSPPMIQFNLSNPRSVARKNEPTRTLGHKSGHGEGHQGVFGLFLCSTSRDSAFESAASGVSRLYVYVGSPRSRTHT